MSLNINDIVTDGSAKFRVVKSATTKDIAEAISETKTILGFRQKNKAYNAGDIAYHETLPTGWYLLCTTAGTSSNSDLIITSPNINDTLTDGTVTWTICKMGSDSGDTPDRIAVAIPTTNSTFTYDGTYQTPIFTNYDSTKMTKSGDEGATNVGNYVTIFTLGENYKWSDDTIAPKSVSWTITPAMVTKNIVPRVNGEGTIGDNTPGSEKYWNAGYFLNINDTDAIEMAKFNADLQWKANTIYAKGDIVFTSGLKAGLYLECTTNGTSNATKFTIPANVVPDSTTITDNTIVWTVRKIGSGSGGGVGIEIGDVTNTTVSANHARVMLTWTDPENLVISGATLAKWAGTLVVRKEGSEPVNKNDGTLVIDSTSKNAYASTPFVDSGLTDGVTYYYKFFPYTTGSTYTAGTVLNATPNRTAVAIPTTDSQLTYDGTYQTPVFTNYDNTKMTKSGDEGATNAGNYVTVFTLGEDYKWNDNTIAPKSVAWSIAKAAGGITLSKNSVSLDTTTTSDTVTVSRLGDGAISVESSDTSVVTVSLSGDTITVTEVDEGSATITVSVAEGTNYLATSQTISAEVTFISSILNDNSWAVISQVAQAGEGELYWDVGDVKMIELNGNIGEYFTADHLQLGVFILDFNHPENGVAENNIIFGGFKTALSGGVDVALCDSNYSNSFKDGRVCFSMNHKTTDTSGANKYGYNYGGWKGSDLRYDILGATSTAPSQYNVDKNTSNIGYDATAATLTSPKANTFLAALPSDLRSVLRLRTHYVDNKGNKSEVDANVTAVTDAVSLLAEFEIFGLSSYANQYEQNQQQQMKYYANGNSKKRYKNSDSNATVYWWECSPRYRYESAFCTVDTYGNANGENFYSLCGAAIYSFALAPVLKV